MSWSWTKIFEQATNIKVKSITDTLFLYTILFCILGLIAAIFKTLIWVIILLFSFGAVFLIIGMIFFIYFALKKPDYLRSEEFQISKQSIEILGDKDNSLNPNVKNIVPIASPYSKQIGNSNNKNEFGK